jgi:hypothetical protein
VKKTGHAAEEGRPDTLAARRWWFNLQLDLDLERLVFIDEIWTATIRAFAHGCCRTGQRLHIGSPHGHRKTTTLVAAMVLDGPINGDWFETHLEQILVPTLKLGDTVIMNNLSSHKRLLVKM